MKGGPFTLSLQWPDLALGSFRSFSIKWSDQCEVCGLKKKKGHCYSRAFSLKGNHEPVLMSTPLVFHVRIRAQSLIVL